MRCADCGQEIAQDQAICAYCGKPAPQEQADAAAAVPIQASLSATQISEDAPPGGTWIGKLELQGQDIFVGRLPSSDIALEGDSLVSRRHVRLFAKQGAYYVEDLFSSNGTLVNGEELITPRMLSGGETIRVGTFELHYECQSAALSDAARAAQRSSGGTGPLGIAERAIHTTASLPRGTPVPTPPGKRDSSIHAFAKTGAPAVSSEATTDRNPALSDIRVLKEQVGAIGKLVQQRADDEALQLEALSGTLIHAYGVLTSLLDARESTSRSTEAKAQSLAALARETARDPEHIFQALRLASHAGEIAVILEYLESGGIGRDVLRILRELQAQLADLPQVRAASGQRRMVSAGPRDERP